MSTNRSRDDFLRFLAYLGDKGLIPLATASSRRATAGKVTAILSDDEAADVTALDLDDVMRRFDHLNPHQYTPGSLQAYKSRMKTALDDFRSYCENPLNFRPSGQQRTKVKPSNGEQQKKPIRGRVKTNDASATATPSVSLPNVTVLPIALRAGLTVQIAGLPFDLTAAEAKKIANIILAHGGD
jgi:hypothetical protein